MGVIDKKFEEAIKNGVESEREGNESAPEETTVERRRTPRESEDELVAPYVASMGYKEQVSTIRNEDGEIVQVAWGTKGSRRPDGFDPETHNIVEVKNYNITTSAGVNRLANNIRKQADASQEQYGDVEMVFVVDLKGQNATIEDVEKLTSKLEEKCPEADVDYRW